MGDAWSLKALVTALLAGNVVFAACRGVEDDPTDAAGDVSADSSGDCDPAECDERCRASGVPGGTCFGRVCRCGDGWDAAVEDATDDVEEPDVPVVCDVEGADAAGDGGPWPLPCCSVLAGEFLAYVEAHGDCTADSECVSAVPMDDWMCSFHWLAYEEWERGTPAIRRDALTAEFEDWVATFHALCRWAPYVGHGLAWTDAYDMPYAWFVASCPDGRCFAEVEYDSRSCF